MKIGIACLLCVNLFFSAFAQEKKDVQALIRRMSRENPLWGAPRIQAKLRFLGRDVAAECFQRERLVLDFFVGLMSLLPLAEPMPID